MRIAHDAGTEQDAKASMRALASAFPGALRELDRLAMPKIESRIAELESAIDSQDPLPLWAEYSCAYHGWMRGILKVRSLLGDERDAQRMLETLSARYVAEWCEPPLGEFDLPSLTQILSTSEGRSNPWVFQRIASNYERSAKEIEEKIFDFSE